MKIKDALIRGVLAGFSVDSFQADKVLLDAGIPGDDDYSSSNEQAVDECAIKILHTWCVSSVKEGSYAVSYDRARIESLIGQLSKKWGLSNPLDEEQPTVTAVSVW